MTSNTLHFQDCLDTDTAESRELLKQARSIVEERGAKDLLEQLGRPLNYEFSPELRPYISLVLLESFDATFPISPVPTPNLPPGRPSIQDVIKASEETVLSTNCETIDDLLGGGFPLGSGGIFEISGQAGVGKTQLAMQIALMSTAAKSFGGLELPSIYVCTEGRPSVSRMAEIDNALSSQFRTTPGEALKNVIIEPLESADALLQWAQFRLPFLLRKTGARVLIVDSITAVYRPDFTDALARAPHLVQTVVAMRQALTLVLGICICVNQVSQVLDNYNTLNTTAPALGPTWSNCVSTRLFLSRRRGNPRRYAKITHSSYLPSTEGIGEPYLITEDGVVVE